MSYDSRDPMNSPAMENATPITRGKKPSPFFHFLVNGNHTFTLQIMSHREFDLPIPVNPFVAPAHTRHEVMLSVLYHVPHPVQSETLCQVGEVKCILEERATHCDSTIEHAARFPHPWIKDEDVPDWNAELFQHRLHELMGWLEQIVQQVVTVPVIPESSEIQDLEWNVL